MELLVCRVRKGKIKPVFASLDEGNISIASELVGMFSRFIGRKQGELFRAIGELEERSPAHHRFIRGLKTLLLRRCVFEVQAKVEPFEARKVVYEEANKVWVLDREDREKALARAASKLGVAVDELELSLWADYEEEQVLKDFEAIEAEELLREYNLSLAQTMLFKAASMTACVSRGYRELLWRIKRLGLMYIAEKQGENFHLYIEGPLSLLKMTERYGTAMAKLLPAILGAHRWRIKASIVLRSPGWENSARRSPRILEFELDDSQRGLLKVSTESSLEPERRFDSAVEERFARAFIALRTGWTLTREPEPLVAGESVFIPDFVFEKGKLRVFFEIVGFWTQSYLEKKLSKLRELEEVNLIVAVDKSLVCSAFKELKGFRVIYYEKEVPLKEVLGYLREFEEREVKRELRKLKQGGIHLEGDVIRLSELAREQRASYEAVKRAVEGAEGYVSLGKELISIDKLRKLKERLNSLPREARYKDVASLLREEGVSSIDSVLEYLGYEMRWHSLDPESVVVVRAARR
jgi:hypothetical protein